MMPFQCSLVALPQLAKSIRIIKAYISEQTKSVSSAKVQILICVIVRNAVIQCPKAG